MKKLTALLLSAMLILSATFAMADVIKIGVVTPDGDHGFTGESIAHARAELDALVEAGKIEYKYVAGGEASKQIAGIEDLLNNWEPDTIVLWPMEGEQLRNAAQTIIDAEVDLIVYDRLIEGFEGMKAEIMGDNEGIGNMMGEYLLKYFEEDLKAGEEISYLQFIGDSSTVSAQRTKGMMDVIEASEYAAQFVIAHDPFPTDWSNTKSQELMENWLNTADPAAIEGLDFICTHDDEIVDGLMIALDSYAGDHGIRLISSVGGRRETLATFEGNEDIDLVTYYFSPSFIREAVRLAVAAANGEQYQEQDVAGQIFLIPSIEVDKNTVEAFKESPEFIERYSLGE